MKDKNEGGRKGRVNSQSGKYFKKNIHPVCRLFQDSHNFKKTNECSLFI